MFAQRDPVNVPIRTVPASGRPRESSRSSRRKVSSTGPQVVLGGGAGLVGGPGRVNDGASQEVSQVQFVP